MSLDKAPEERRSQSFWRCHRLSSVSEVMNSFAQGAIRRFVSALSTPAFHCPHCERTARESAKGHSCDWRKVISKNDGAKIKSKRETVRSKAVSSRASAGAALPLSNNVTVGGVKRNPKLLPPRHWACSRVVFYAVESSVACADCRNDGCGGRSWGR